MAALTDKTRAESLLENIKPELMRILENAPPFGSCGIEVIFHENDISRIIVKAEVSRKPRGARL